MSKFNDELVLQAPCQQLLHKIIKKIANDIFDFFTEHFNFSVASPLKNVFLLHALFILPIRF